MWAFLKTASNMFRHCWIKYFDIFNSELLDRLTFLNPFFEVFRLQSPRQVKIEGDDAPWQDLVVKVTIYHANLKLLFS